MKSGRNKTTIFPTECWGAVSPSGKLLPSTIRVREGDAINALSKHSGIKHRHDIDKCRVVKLKIDLAV